MGRSLLGGSVNIECEIKWRRRGVGTDKTPMFGKVAECDAV